jgi:hypothetical protein
VRRLANVINGELDLLNTFAGTGRLRAQRVSAETFPPSDLR